MKMSSLQAYQVPCSLSGGSTGWGEDLVDESLRDILSACKVRCLWICLF